MAIDLNNIIYLITSIFSTYIVYKFMGIFFDRSEINKSVEFLTYLIYLLVISTTFLALNIPMFTLVINIVLFFGLTFNYKASMRSRIFVTFYICLILVAIESIVVISSGYIPKSLFEMNPIYFSISGIISVKIISYIVVLFMGNYKTRQREIEIPIIHWISIFLIPLGSLYIIINLMANLNFKTHSISASIGILLGINIIAFYLYDVLSKMYEEKVEKTMLKEQNKYYQTQLNILENTKSIHHDIKNHLSIVREYIQVGEREKAINYLDQFNKEVYGDEKLSKSGNIDIDSILNYKLNEAIKNDISVSIESKLPSDINVSSLDIVVVLGNLLDNAIEANSKITGEKEIDVKIRYQNNILFIHIENTFDSALIYHGDRIRTSKEDRANHGIGLKNIEKIIEKYNGLMNIHHKDNKFNTDIIMYIN